LDLFLPYDDAINRLFANLDETHNDKLLPFLTNHIGYRYITHRKVFTAINGNQWNCDLQNAKQINNIKIKSREGFPGWENKINIIDGVLYTDFQYKLLKYSLRNGQSFPSSKTYSNTQLTGNIYADIAILIRLSFKDILQMFQVNKYFSSLANNILLWKMKIKLDFPLRSKYIYYPEYLSLYDKNPRVLYSKINKPAKRIILQNQKYPDLIITIDKDTILKTWQLKHQNETIPYYKKMREIITKLDSRFSDLPLLRGDFIILESCVGWSNAFSMIWDGQILLPLEIGNNEYNRDESLFLFVPKEMAFPEFPYDHFHKEIQANTILHLSDFSIKEAIRTFDANIQRATISDLHDSFELKIRTEKYISNEEFLKIIEQFPFINSDKYDTYIKYDEANVLGLGNIIFSDEENYSDEEESSN